MQRCHDRIETGAVRQSQVPGGQAAASGYCPAVTTDVLRARALDRVERLCAANDGDDRSLRIAVLAEIRRVIPFDAFVWILTDPETAVGVAPLADVPSVSELPRLIRLKYLTPLNRWTELAESVALLCTATDGSLDRSLFWREALARYGVHDLASLVFRDAFGWWAFLDLWRSGSPDDFTAAEATVLAAMTPHITAALRRCQARTFATAGAVPRTGGPAVLILSADLDVRAQTPEAEALLRTLVPIESDRRPIPAAAYNVAAQLLCSEAGIDDRPAMSRTHVANGLWLTLRAARLGGEGEIARQDIAVTIAPATPAERTAVFVRAVGFSGREAELMERLVAGADTRDIAQELILSEYTVQDHLKSMFAKTGTHSRRALVARAAGR